MKHRVVLLALLSIQLVTAQTNVSGWIQADSTWDLAHSPFVVTGTLWLDAGYTLTVDSGVVVLFRQGTNFNVSGTVMARHAVFTSEKDTAGGSPSKGDWSYIRVGDNGVHARAVFDTCRIKYGGTASTYNDTEGSLWLLGGTAVVRGCEISQSLNSGIRVGGTSETDSLLIADTKIFSCTWPVSYAGKCQVVPGSGNLFTGNTHDAFRVAFNDLYVNMTLPAIDIPYAFLNWITVRTGATLTVASGNILKFGEGVGLTIEGGFSAVADVAATILFTAYTDDNAGGDSNADAAATFPAQSYWYGLFFDDASADANCIVRRATFQFGGRGNNGAVTTTDASPTIDSCDFASNYIGAMLRGVSNPVLSNNTIGSSYLVPIAMSFSSSPVFTNNTFSFSDNRFDAIGLLGGDLPANAMLPIRSVTAIPNVTYLLLETLVIPSGKTLTINKGIVIKGHSEWSWNPSRIVVQGKLVASGTADSMIVFTSAKDDIYGNPFDTNKDGTDSNPERHDWGGITFEGGSDPTSVLNYCRIRFATMQSIYYNTRWISGGAVTFINASPTISNCIISDAEYGLYAFQGSNPAVSSTTISNTQYTPIAMSVSANPTLTALTFVNTAWTALGIIGEPLGLSGTLTQRNVAGYTNITYLLLEDLTINAGTYVTVDPGVVVKANNAGIFVDGGLKAKGTIAGGRVTFTSIKDDNVGNPTDTNGDGNATSPQHGNWRTIRFQGTSDDAFCLLDSCTIRFGGTGSDNWGLVTFADAGGKISNSLITDSQRYGVSAEGSATPVVQNVTIQNCQLDPLAISLTANPTYSGIVFSGNRSSGIKILEGTLSSDARLFKRDVAGINNIAYIVEYLTIGQNAVLTIDPGVVVKFVPDWVYRYLTVEGGLIANGTASQKIIFTSLKDDSNGGDTNNDGNATSPNKGDWWAISFEDVSRDSVNSMRHCDIRYGGAYSWNDTDEKHQAMVRISSAKVVVDSCVLEQSSSAGFGIYGSANPSITNTKLYNITLTPVTMSMFSQPTFAGNTALNVGNMALGIVPENYSVDATVPVRNFGGYTNITYYLYYNGYTGDPAVNSGTVITIPAGVVFKGPAGLKVSGTLIVNGSDAQPVVFTDERDDSYGNPMDTNGDGMSTIPTQMDWRFAVEFNDVSEDAACVVRNAVIRYKEHGIILQQASPVIRKVRFEADKWGVRLNGVSTPAVDSCAFVDLVYAPLKISLVSYPRTTLANTISGTTYRAIGVLGETLAQDITLLRRTFAGIEAIPYFFFEDYSIGTSAVLTIEPGVVCKFYESRRLTVRKGLIAEGKDAPDSTIVFTDFRDDTYGGDMNANGTATVPAMDGLAWAGILFEGESLDPLCRLSYVAIRWAGHNWWNYDQWGGVVTSNASPTVTYASITRNHHGVLVQGASDPVINYSDIYQNSGYGIKNADLSFTIDATNNWWGTNDGPTHTGNPDGTGDDVTDGVNYTPFTTAGSANPVIGDVSLNGSVQAFDAAKILRWVVSKTGPDSLSDKQKRVADVSGNGGVDTVAITAYDASLILQYVVGIIPSFPAAGTEGTGGLRLADGMLKAGDVQASASLASGTVGRGAAISLPLQITGASGMTSFQAFVRFDEKIFTVEGVVPAGIAAGRTLEYAVSAPGELRIACAGTSAMGEAGTVAEIRLTASNDVQGTVTSGITVEHFLANESLLSASIVTGVVEVIGRPVSYELRQNYPNPFNPTTTIRFDVPDDNADVQVVIFNLLGQHVRTLVSGQLIAGVHTAVWDGRDDAGRQVTSGTYICLMRSGEFRMTRKLMLLR